MRSLNLINKDLNYIFKHAKKIKEQFSPSKKNHPLKLEKTITKALLKVENLRDLPQNIAQIAELKKYQSFHFVTHEKGQRLANCFSYQQGSTTTHQKYKVTDFNLLFTTVNKSKNKLFNAQNLKTNVFPILGYFHASALRNQKQNILLIVSHDGFLAPSLEEINFFKLFSNLLSKKLEKLIFEKKVLEKNNIMLEMVKKMPFPIKIKDKNENIIFSSPEHCFSLSEKITFNKGVIELYGLTQEDSSDLFHRERLELLGELLNTLRHELSNPLFGLKLASDLLTSLAKDQEDLSFIKHILTSSKRCEDIIENFSTLYKKDSSQTMCNLKSIIEEALLLTKSETKQHYPDYSNLTELTEVMANSTWLVQVIFNFIVNSSQALSMKIFTLGEKPQINVTVENGESSQVKISVIDNGIGFDDKVLSKISTPFFTTKDEGTGIGLSISKHLASKMNGYISFQSPGHNQGATFCLHLPNETKL